MIDDDDDDECFTLKEFKRLLYNRGFGVYIYKNKRGERRAKYYLRTHGSSKRIYLNAASTPAEMSRWVCFRDLQCTHSIAIQELMEVERIAGLVAI